MMKELLISPGSITDRMSTFNSGAINQKFTDQVSSGMVLVLSDARHIGNTMFLKDLINMYYNEPLLFPCAENNSTTGNADACPVSNFKMLTTENFSSFKK